MSGDRRRRSRARWTQRCGSPTIDGRRDPGRSIRVNGTWRGRPRVAGRRARHDPARPRGDLRAARDTELGQDVLDVGVCGLGRDPSSSASSGSRPRPQTPTSSTSWPSSVSLAARRSPRGRAGSCRARRPATCGRPLPVPLTRMDLPGSRRPSMVGLPHLCVHRARDRLRRSPDTPLETQEPVDRGRGLLWLLHLGKVSGVIDRDPFQVDVRGDQSFRGGGVSEARMVPEDEERRVLSRR